MGYSMKVAFDNKKYLDLQSKAINERISKFDNKLYLEFGGKLFDDYNAARVLPGFKSNIKIELLKKLKDKTEIIFCINANDIEKRKLRADYGITYDMDVMRLIDNLRNIGMTINSVVITLFEGQKSAEIFRKKLERRNIKTYIHTYTKGYPTDVNLIVSDEGYGANPYIETTKPLVVVTAPGPNSGKLGTSLSQLYHEYKRGVKAGYAKFETFPIWNLPLKHPVNISYEAATADLKDTNLIDYFHLDEYNEVAVNYNRDLEVFPILSDILKKITGECIYKSPTDMGVNKVGFCITDDDAVKKASKEEINRRYYKALCDYKKGLLDEEVPKKIKVLMNELNIDESEREVIKIALKKHDKEGVPVIALKLHNGVIVTGKNTKIMTAGASLIINSIKKLAHIKDEIYLLSPVVLEPLKKLKEELYENSLLNIQDVLLGLSIAAATNPTAELALSKLNLLKFTDAHSTHFIPEADESMFRTLKINITSEAEFYSQNLYFD